MEKLDYKFSAHNIKEQTIEVNKCPLDLEKRGVQKLIRKASNDGKYCTVLPEEFSTIGCIQYLLDNGFEVIKKNRICKCYWV